MCADRRQVDLNTVLPSRRHRNRLARLRAGHERRHRQRSSRPLARTHERDGRAEADDQSHARRSHLETPDRTISAFLVAAIALEIPTQTRCRRREDDGPTTILPGGALNRSPERLSAAYSRRHTFGLQAAPVACQYPPQGQAAPKRRLVAVTSPCACDDTGRRGARGGVGSTSTRRHTPSHPRRSSPR
jgi:hypothetical protein